MLYAVIMAGGSGTRLWPESRRDWPKQLLTLQPPLSMIQTTVRRVDDLIPPERVLIATTERLAGKIGEQLPRLGPDAMVCEPCGRNTAPCIALAANRIARLDPEAIMLVMPADHVIQDTDAFCEAVRVGETLIHERPERLVTFGVKPSYPAESFGYIERGAAIGSDNQGPERTGRPPTFEVKQFHEKPEAPVAQAYFEAGTFAWNAGIFLWKAKTILAALERFEPEMFGRLKRIDEAANTPEADDVLAREFAAIEGKSIDFAVMEHYDDAVMIEAPFDWDDVGSWRSLERLRRPDADGNLIDAARHLAVDTRNTIVRSADSRHVVALMGVEDLIVIVTPDATLVAHKENEESIRQIIGELRKRGWEEYL